jgi:PST family polysaccharide transporter
MMTLSAIPLIASAARGTVISVHDILLTLSRPLISGIVAAGLVLALKLSYGPFLSPLPRLVLGIALVLAGYLGMLLYVMGQKQFYLDLLQGFRTPPSAEEPFAVSA